MADYFVEGGDVLENKLGISDSRQLHKAEEGAFSDAAADILTEDFSNTEFSFDFFKSLHGRLFGKVYPFAGQIRTVNNTKNNSSIPFCMADFILPEADRIFEKLQSENYLKDKPIDQFADSIAELAMDLNALHPFREGNGRTIRLFLQLLAGNAGFLIDYDIVSHEDLIEVDKQAFLGNDKPIREMYRAIIAVIK